MDDLEFFERRGDVGLLLLQLLDERIGALRDESNLLRTPFAPITVESEELLHLREREADGLRPQDELQPGSFPPRIDSAAICARRGEKPLCLVEAYRARRDPEFAGEFRDTVEPLLLGEAWA